MYQRFALIWPAMCLASMGAHVFVAQDAPSFLGVAVTSVLAAPLAAIAARFDFRILTASLMLAIQVIAHQSLSLPMARGALHLVPHLSQHREHAHSAGFLSSTTSVAESLAHLVSGPGRTVLVESAVGHLAAGHSAATHSSFEYSAVAHSSASLPMLLGHLIAATVLTLVVSRVDGFINQLARFFGALLGFAKPASLTTTSNVQLPHEVLLVVAQWLRGCVSLRGPPISFSL